MGRLKQYSSAAAKQCAYRDRLAQTTAVVDRASLDRLHERLERLQQAIARAARQGDPMACRCSAASIDTLLDNLIAAFGQMSPSAAREGSK